MTEIRVKERGIHKTQAGYLCGSFMSDQPSQDHSCHNCCYSIYYKEFERECRIGCAVADKIFYLMALNMFRPAVCLSGGSRTTGASKLGSKPRVIRKTGKPALAACLASCLALSDGCKGKIHAQYSHWPVSSAKCTAKVASGPLRRVSGNGPPQTKWHNKGSRKREMNLFFLNAFCEKFGYVSGVF